MSRSFPTVAPFASVSGKSKTSTLPIPDEDAVASSRNNSTAVVDCGDDELTARRGACCLDDAVFSRTPNCVGRVFMLLRGFRESLSLILFCALAVGVLAQPDFEFVVAFE